MGNVKREIERLKEKKRKRLLQDREKKELEKIATRRRTIYIR